MKERDLSFAALLFKRPQQQGWTRPKPGSFCLGSPIRCRGPSAWTSDKLAGTLPRSRGDEHQAGLELEPIWDTNTAEGDLIFHRTGPPKCPLTDCIQVDTVMG